MQALLQELEVSCSGRVFKIGGETKDAAFNIFRLHRSNVQEIVGIDMVNLAKKTDERRLLRVRTIPPLLPWPAARTEMTRL